MAIVVHLVLTVFMSSLRVKGHTKSWKAHQCIQHFGENDSPDNSKIQRVQKDDNARINKVLAMRPGLAKILQKVSISRNIESSETDHHIVRGVLLL